MRCPRCGSPISDIHAKPSCVNYSCDYSTAGFPMVDGQPVLIDFEASVFARESYREAHGSVMTRDVAGRSLGSRLHRFTFGGNPVAASNCEKFVALLKKDSARPVVLVVGGATVGSGADSLYNDPDIEVVGSDVFSSENTALVADAHRLPFHDATFDGVWIQAVLEHVLEPATVAAEIHRVLKPKGLVYAETPFMQQVHERAYDFSRFTRSGHRWLFRHFAEVEAGAVTGAGVALLWSIRYFSRTLGAGDKMSRIVTLPFFWLRFLDRFGKSRARADAAGGVYFMGRRAEQAILPSEMPLYYDVQARA
ncbi:class I SAM-dependent methyltransferase [Tardiphaga alba]|uniref:Class I SAM-dependent methyltransferase n=2 Tax=Tardiphaga alba TaxID=340268 RepID=A0ABX8AJ34_9BRAD|nr:class I SAM-dependent methyltransferase [Tardiphaga alba]